MTTTDPATAERPASTGPTGGTRPTGATGAGPTSSHAPDPKRWLALGIIALAQLMVVLDASIVNIALPHAQADLHITDANRQWVITAYTLTFGGLLLLGGRIADYVGRKRVFLVGLLAFAAASALGGIAPNATLLFAARALQGAAGALLAPAALSLISVTFTEARERAKAFGVYGAIAGGGAAIGLILGGVLTEYASWRWCLLVNVPIALAAFAAAVPVVRESRAEGKPSYDIPGAILVTLGLVSLVYGFTKAAEKGVGWGSPITLGLIGGAIVLLALFIVVEHRSNAPLLPLRVPGDRNRGGSYLANLLVGSGLFAMFLFLTFYFQVTLHYSALKAGMAFLPFSGGIIVSAGITSQLLPRFGPRRLMLTGLTMSTLGLLYLTQISPTTSWVSHVLPAELLMSLGMGLVFVPLASTALIGVSGHDAGVASALVNTTQQIGGSLGTALLNTIYTTAVTGYFASHALTPAVQQAGLVHGYTVAFAWGAALLAAALVVVFVLVRAGRESVSNEAAVVPA